MEGPDGEVVQGIAVRHAARRCRRRSRSRRAGCRRAPDRRDPAEDRLLPESPAPPPVEAGHQVLVLLGDEDEEVQPPVLVEVDDRDVDRARPGVDRVVDELRQAPVRGLVLVVDRRSHLAEAIGATTRSRSPSPSKSAACTSAFRGRWSIRMRFSNCIGPVWRIQTIVPFSWSEGRNSPRSAIRRSCRPSLSRSTISAWAGLLRMAICRRTPGARAGSATKTDPRPMSQTTISSLPSPSRSKKRTFDDDRLRRRARRVEGVPHEHEPAVVVRPRWRQREHLRRPGLEPFHDLVEVELPEEALLAGRDRRCPSCCARPSPGRGSARVPAARTRAAAGRGTSCTAGR